MAVEVAERLIKDGEIRRGYLGVILADLTEDLAKAFDAKQDGALVHQVIEDRPAQRAGMEPGDIIIRYEGEDIEDLAELRLLVARTEPDASVELTVRRDGEEKALNVTVGTLSESEPVARSEARSRGEFLPGVRIAGLDDELRKRFGHPSETKGVVITEVDPGSPAAAAGLREGQVLLEVEREAVRSAGEATAALNRADPTDVVLLRVATPDGSRFIAVEKGEGK
jgi:serine protease Do